jgi:starch synthase
MKKRKVLLVATEMAPLACVGGVAGYILGIAGALRRRGHDVRIAVPGYAFLLKNAKLLTERLVVGLGVGATQVGKVYETSVAVHGETDLQLPVYLLSVHPHFATARDTKDVYSWPNHEPWIAFCRGVLDFLGSQTSQWVPDAIHCHDAHAALLATYIRHLRETNPDAPIAGARTLLTIHNLLSQGLGDPGLVAYAGLPWSLFSIDCFEYYGRANCLKAGLVSADMVNAVSRTYAEEICSGPDFGFGLEGVLLGLRRAGKLHGILNGIDENRWRMPGLKYDGTDSIDGILRARRDARKTLYADWKWKDDAAPVLSFRARWDEQKGARILAESMPEITEFARCVISTGEVPGTTPELRKAWTTLDELAKARPDTLVINPPQLGPVEATALHYTISDFLLMPSRYEPCGLAQMECQRFGVIPIVRKTGGLADTVSELETSRFPSPNGFLFEDSVTDHDMVQAARRAYRAFQNKVVLKRLIQNTLLQKNSWDTRIAQYEALYG